MKLPRIAIQNHQFTIVVFLLFFLFGIVSFFTMPRSEDPPIAPNGTSIIAIYPGASPSDMEQLIVDPVEEKVNELDNIKRINSHIGNGVASVAVEFQSGTDMDETYSKIVQKIGTIRSELPEDILKLEVNRWILSDFVIVLQLALISENATYQELDFELERLKKMLQKVYGVKKVKKWAIPDREIRIAVDPARLAAMNISLNKVVGIIRGNNQNIPGGSIDVGVKRYNIKTSGAFTSVDEIKDTIINSFQGKIVYLKDIADVYFTTEDNNYFARVNKKRAVFLTVNQKEGTNIFRVIEGVKTRINKFAQLLPGSMKMYYVFNQADSVRARLDSFFSNLIQGLILVGLVILFSVGLREAGIVMTAIPLSIFIGLGLLDLSGYGIEQMSIAGLVIALGLLVDNAIVVIENISRFSLTESSMQEAAIKGTRQVGWAIVSATVTTLFAFLPIILMKDETGDYIRSMPLTVFYTLSASLLIALTLTPFLAKKFLPREKKKVKKGKFKELLQRFINKYYRRILSYTLNHPKKIIFLAVLALVMSLILVPFVGVSYFPKAEKPQFVININTPEGSNIDYTDTVTRYVESVLSTKDIIKTYASNIGRGNPQIHYNINSSEKNISHTQIFVELEFSKQHLMEKLIADLRKEFLIYAGAKIEVKEIEMGKNVEAPIAIKILGDNIKVLRDLSGKVESIFKSTGGTINIDNPQAGSKTDLKIKINRGKAGILGISLAAVDQTIRTAVAGAKISKYRDQDGKEYDIVVRYPVKDKFSLDDFNMIQVTSLSGKNIPLSQISSLELKSTAREIQHFNFQRCVTIVSDVLPGYNENEVTKKIMHKLDKLHWPKGYGYYVAGKMETRQESFGGMGRAALIALIAILAVLVLQFKSFSQPWIVFSAIPLAFIGSILALFLTGNTFSFTAFIGLTALIGIVVNNSIILVDYTNQLRRKNNYDILKALKESGEARFTPIILTTATTIGGLLPLTLKGGTIWAPMGWTIIGGLITSTVLTLIVVPALYKVYAGKQR